MEKNTQPGDLIVLVPGYLEMPFDYYYDNATDGTRELGVASVAELENIGRIQGDGRIFYIITGDITAVNPEGDVMRWIERNATYVGDYTKYLYLFFTLKSSLFN